VRYDICQLVKIVDMNDEIILEVVFDHGEVETPVPTIGATVVTNLRLCMIKDRVKQSARKLLIWK
jgi:hypothetical protein